jgi:hypothetical protein
MDERPRPTTHGAPTASVERLTKLGFVVRLDTGMSGMIRVMGVPAFWSGA